MLPKIQQPIFSLLLPISKKTIKYRPMLVKEEKMLLLAKESKDIRDIVNNVVSVINNCILSEDIDVLDLPMVEFEYIFVNLRARSISNVITLKYYDTYDKKITHDVVIDIDDIKIVNYESFNPKIMLGDNLGMVLRLPNLEISQRIDTKKDEATVGIDIIKNCIDYIFDNESIYRLQDYSVEEVEEFIDSLSLDNFNKMENIFKNLPRLEYKTSFKNSKGEDVNIELTRLEDFF